MIEEEKARPAHRLPRSRSVTRFWLVAKDRNYPVEMLTVDCGGDKALPVFSFEEEATFYTGGLKLHLTEDFRESAQAFIEKRPPNFKGR